MPNFEVWLMNAIRSEDVQHPSTVATNSLYASKSVQGIRSNVTTAHPEGTVRKRKVYHLRSLQ